MGIVRREPERYHMKQYTFHIDKFADRRVCRLQMRRSGFVTPAICSLLTLRGSARARRTRVGLPELITSWGFIKWAEGALFSSTLRLKKEPAICGGADFLPRLGLIFLVSRSRSWGDGGWGFHLRDGTQQSAHATARPDCGLISRRLTPLRRSGHSVSLVRRFSASLPSGHPSRTTFGPSPRR